METEYNIVASLIGFATYFGIFAFLIAFKAVYQLTPHAEWSSSIFAAAFLVAQWSVLLAVASSIKFSQLVDFAIWARALLVAQL